MVAARAARGVRTNATVSGDKFTRLFHPDEAAAKEFKTEYFNTQAHAKHTASLWKKISVIVCVPALIGASISTYILESRHHEHAAAHPRPSDDELPPEYEFQNIRATKYFWGDGDKTLFWNSKVNHHKKE